MIIWFTLSFLCSLFLMALVGRAVLSWVQLFARDWRPKGMILVLAELLYTVTDPAVKFVSKLIPPLRIGPTAIDIGFIVLFLAVSFLGNFFTKLAIASGA